MSSSVGIGGRGGGGGSRKGGVPEVGDVFRQGGCIGFMAVTKMQQ